MKLSVLETSLRMTSWLSAYDPKTGVLGQLVDRARDLIHSCHVNGLVVAKNRNHST